MTKGLTWDEAQRECQEDSKDDSGSLAVVRNDDTDLIKFLHKMMLDEGLEEKHTWVYGVSSYSKILKLLFFLITEMTTRSTIFNHVIPSSPSFYADHNSYLYYNVTRLYNGNIEAEFPFICQKGKSISHMVIHTLSLGGSILLQLFLSFSLLKKNNYQPLYF